MIDLPRCDLHDLRPLADWVEICVLTDTAGRMSQALVADVVHDAGQVGTAITDFFPGDETFATPDDTSDDDAAHNCADVLWSMLSLRCQRLGDKYPLHVQGDEILRTTASWQELASFTAMVLMGLLVDYDHTIEIKAVDGFSFRQLFEKIVQASALGLFKGSTVRFGWPREPGWPTGIEDRIHQFAEEMGLRVENLEGKLDPHDKDRTLDVASRLSCGDDGPGSVVFLTQCATGINWKKKRGEPYPSMWLDLLAWNSELVRAVAVPWWFGYDRDYERLRRWFNGAVLLDRPRLLAGQPDKFLENKYIELIRQWCDAQINQLPTL